MTKQNIDQKISDILSGSKTTADDLQSLTAEISTAIQDAEVAAREGRDKSLDPLVAPAEAEAAAKTATVLELKAARYKTALPSIEAKLRDAVAADIRDRCLVQRGEIEKKLTAAVEAFREYPALVNRLVEIFNIAEAVDSEVEHFNYNKVTEVPRLITTELLARELGGFNSYNPSLNEEIQLPSWHCSSNVWPHRTSVNSIAAALYSAPSSHPGARWHEQIPARNAAQQAEQQRMNEYYEAQHRSKEDRDNAERIAAREAALRQRG